MSDFNFYGTNTPVAINTGLCTVTDEETITTPLGNPLGAPGDIVYMKINATQGVVVVVQDTVTRGKDHTLLYLHVHVSIHADVLYKLLVDYFILMIVSKLLFYFI